ncbi:replication factor C large subunit [Candidatus Woesearchaeota archaeon]|nr:replication factor C large subunit [Candidatus Woesearchaeota archaeon]
MALFTSKYAPQNSSQVFGQQLAVSQLKDFIVNYRQQKYKAALLQGPIGNGKTSSVYALARELNYNLIEINSSDIRNEDAITSFLGSAVNQQSLFFRPKIILVDEIDNVSGTQDRGCIPTIIKIMEKSHFPIIFTANDVSESKYKSLLKNSLLIEYHPLQYRTIAHALQWVAEQENISVDEKAVNTLARKADGDLRSALLDFQVCTAQGACTVKEVAALSDRKRTESILTALQVIFKSSSVENSLPALDNLDMDTSDIFSWIDANLPQEYLDAKSLAKAYEWLSRADVFQGRITRQQHWRFLVYINNLLTAGISSAKEQKNTEFVPYHRTMRFLRMWQAKMKWAQRKGIASKLALATHTSQKAAVQQVPYLRAIFCKRVDEHMVRELDLNEEEVEWLQA